MTFAQTIEKYDGVLTVETADSLIVTIAKDAVKEFFTFLRDECEFQTLMDITGVDFPEREQRFEVVYQLLSLTKNERIRVKVCVDEDTPIASITSLYNSADWLERETYDMFGVKFTGHPNLERILTDYNFEGYPLRKDFPLGGFTEVEYDETEGKVVYRNVETV